MANDLQVTNSSIGAFATATVPQHVKAVLTGNKFNGGEFCVVMRSRNGCKHEPVQLDETPPWEQYSPEEIETKSWELDVLVLTMKGYYDFPPEDIEQDPWDLTDDEKQTLIRQANLEIGEA